MRPTTMSPTHRAARAFAVTGATLLLAACGSGGTGESPEASRPDDPRAEEQTVSPVPPSPTEVPGAGATPARQAVADLAQRRGVAEEAVSVTSVEAVTWSDGSLGCAEKGSAYTQALVEGTRIRLRVADSDYEYHAAVGRAPFLCESPTQ